MDYPASVQTYFRALRADKFPLRGSGFTCTSFRALLDQLPLTHPFIVRGNQIVDRYRPETSLKLLNLKNDLVDCFNQVLEENPNAFQSPAPTVIASRAHHLSRPSPTPAPVTNQHTTPSTPPSLSTHNVPLTLLLPRSSPLLPFLQRLFHWIDRRKNKPLREFFREIYEFIWEQSRLT